jgi:hypothetical protein
VWRETKAFVGPQACACCVSSVAQRLGELLDSPRNCFQPSRAGQHTQQPKQSATPWWYQNTGYSSFTLAPLPGLLHDPHFLLLPSHPSCLCPPFHGLPAPVCTVISCAHLFLEVGAVVHAPHLMQTVSLYYHRLPSFRFSSSILKHLGSGTFQVRPFSGQI